MQAFVVASLAAQCHRLNRALQRQKRLAVFDRENVVRTLQNTAVSPKRLHGVLPRPGKGNTACKLTAQRRVKRLSQQQSCS